MITPASPSFRRKSPPVSNVALPLYVTASVFSEVTSSEAVAENIKDLYKTNTYDYSRRVYTLAVREGNTPVTDWAFTQSVNNFERNGQCLCSIGNGNTFVTISYNGKQKTVSLFAETGLQTLVSTTNTGYVAGTLGAIISQSVDGGIDEYGTQKALFSSINHTTQTYTRNTQSWLRSNGVTSLPVWCNTWVGAWGNTLVTPRNSIGVKHAATGKGETIRYVDTNGVVYNRTIADLKTISGADICVYTLNEDLPSDIVPLKILGINYANYLTPSNILPMWYTDYQKQALVCHAGNSVSQSYWYHTTPNATDYPERNALYENAISGDSGSARGILVGNEMVLTNCTVSAGSSSGPFIAYYKDAINAKFAEMGSPYTLTEFDLSAYPTI